MTSEKERNDNLRTFLHADHWDRFSQFWHLDFEAMKLAIDHDLPDPRPSTRRDEVGRVAPFRDAADYRRTLAAKIRWHEPGDPLKRLYLMITEMIEKAVAERSPEALAAYRESSLRYSDLQTVKILAQPFSSETAAVFNVRRLGPSQWEMRPTREWARVRAQDLQETLRNGPNPYDAVNLRESEEKELQNLLSGPSWEPLRDDMAGPVETHYQRFLLHYR